MDAVRRFLARFLSAALFACLCADVAAVTPQAGWWWNPAEGGRGFAIEVQNNNLFMAGYLYDVTGRATWYVAGPAAMNGSTFTAPLVSYSGGQTLTGDYRPPSSSLNVGNVSITFADSGHGSLTWPGGTIPIQRFDIVADGAAAGPAADTPQAGWWWNPAESGRGYAIEIQGGLLFMAAFMYDDFGNPVWYASGPAPLVDSRTYRGSWQQYGNGQTLAGSYQPATQFGGDVGPLDIIFDSSTEGRLTLPNGKQIAITRMDFSGGYRGARPTQGDSYTYRATVTSASGQSSNYFVTGYYYFIGSDGSSTYTRTASDPLVTGKYWAYDSKSDIVHQAEIGDAGTKCVFPSKSSGMAAPYYVGQTWDETDIATCTTGATTKTYRLANRGSIIAVEPVSVPAGTFTAIKAVYSTTTTPYTVIVQGEVGRRRVFSAGTALAASTANADPDRSTTTHTCWVDVVLGRTVKCEQTIRLFQDGAVTPTLAESSSYELVSYLASGFGGSTPSASRFAGGWSLSFRGSEGGTCASIVVSSDGAVSGVCSVGISGGLVISGSVNAYGDIRASAGSDGNGEFQLNGRLDPVTGSGSWSKGMFGGSWSMLHN